MKSSLIQKQQIAIEFIETAVVLYEEEKYFSSLHLAGAAEEIFEAYAKDSGIEPTKSTNARLAKKLGDSTYKEHVAKKNIEWVMDYSKNAIKHATKNGEPSFDALLRPKLDAFRMIRRALKNAYLVNAKVAPQLYSFLSKNELEFNNA